MKIHLPSAAAAAFLALATLVHATTPAEQAAAALKSGDLAAAESLLVPLTGTDTTDAAALNVLSQVRMGQRNHKEAIELADRAVKLDPTKPDYHAQLGMACSRRMGEIGFMQQAMLAGKMRKAFEKAVELDPQHIGGLIGLCRYFAGAPEIAGGSPAKAAEYARQVQALNPYLGAIELGNLDERAENFAAALTHYEAAAALRPDHAWTSFLCGRTLARLNRKDEARARFEKSLALNPGLEAATKALAELDAKSN